MMQKPSFDEYMYWSQVVLDRLTTIVHTYSKPPHADVFIAEQERQDKTADAASVLKDLHALTEDKELEAAHPSETARETEERVIANLIPLFEDVLSRLPDWSQDMQKLLKSPWFENCAGRVANDLFCGPGGQKNEGIGSGLAVHGRLPHQLELILEKEQMGDMRAPREALPPRATRQMGREELARRWVQQNGAFLRSAGRMD